MKQLLVGLLALLLTGCASPRSAADAAVRLEAQASARSIRVTVTNIAAEPITVKECSGTHVWVVGGVQQPLYGPCKPQEVALAPGQSVTDQIRVEWWVRGEPTTVLLEYGYQGQPHRLTLQVPHPLFH